MNIKKFLNDPWQIIISLNNRNLLKILPDKLYLKLMYRARIGKKLNLRTPQTFNEKIQWLKLYDRSDIQTLMVDKYLVKKYITDLLGERYVIPLYGVWDKFDEINFDKLPNQFVLKCTHNSGGIVICKDKENFDKEEARKIIEKCLKTKYFYKGREWPYRKVKPRIIAEKYICDKNTNDLPDYKVMVFNGEPQIVQVHKGRYFNHTQDFYNLKWEKLDIYQGCPISEKVDEKPVFIDEMLELSKIIASNQKLVRIDWYYVDNQLLFGEATYFDGSGFIPFEPEKWDYEFGKMIDLY